MLLVALASCDNGDDDAAEFRGLWIAYPESLFGEEGPIRILHADTGQDRTIGDPGIYRNLAWSPGGERLAAIQVLAQPQLVVFDLTAGERFVVPIEFDEAQLSWSPDANRLALLAAGGVAMFSPELEPIGRADPPEEGIAPADYSPGVWSEDSALFGAYWHGYVLVIDRVGRLYLHDPALFVRYPGATRWMTVTGWEAPNALAVFEESDRGSPRRYVLSVEDEEAEVLATSDFEAGTGPFHGLLEQAQEAAGRADVILGHSSAPPDLRWVVALPGEDEVDVRIFVRRDELFLPTSTGRFALADPLRLVRDLSILWIPYDPPSA